MIDLKTSDISKGFPDGSVVKTPPVVQETEVQSLGWEDPLDKNMATTPVFCLGSHGQRGQVGCSPRGHKESDTTAGLANSSEGRRPGSEPAAVLSAPRLSTWR